MGRMRDERKICVGMIAGSHGVKGLVRLHSFTDVPEAIADYSPITDEDGKRSFKISLKNVTKNQFVAEVEGVASKEAADALRGTKLFTPRAALPEAKEREYYEADLVGLETCDHDGKNYGQVWAVHNNGAGPYIEVGRTRQSSFMLPFTDAYVPEVDFDHGKITVVIPDGWLDATKEKEVRSITIEPKTAPHGDA